MKKIFALTILSVVLNTILLGQNVFTVIKVSDPDPFDHPYNFNDALCDTAMYGTLQWAIRKTNDAPPPSAIYFNIAGTGQNTINLNFTLPAVNKQVAIDGTTQPGYNYSNGPSIIIDGTNIPIYNHCFNFSSYDDSSSVIGIHIRNFWASNGIMVFTGNITIKDCMFWNVGGNEPGYPWRDMGIYIAGPNTILQGNIIGTDISGMQNHGCSAEAVYVQSQWLAADNCIIGGSGQNGSNVIANSGWSGITIDNAKYNKITRNRIYDNSGGINLILIAGPPTWGNEGKPAPVIDTLTPAGVLSGTSQPNDIIEIFGSTGSQNANEYVTVTTANSFGNWSAVMTNYNLPYFIATATAPANNTSEFSNAFEITFLPIPPLSVSVTTNDATCNGASNGTAGAMVSGGGPPYTYQWSNGQTTQNITGLTAGTYSLVVTDSLNNSVSEIITINEPAIDTLVNPAACSELFISEYVEGATHNTALELYNPSETPILLINYFVRVFMNGAPTPLIQQLVGLLAPKQTHVIANPNANAAILAIAEQTSNKINFNGDDAIQLVKCLDNIYINIDSIEGLGQNPHAIFDTLELDTLDQIGIPNVTPGNGGWSVGNNGSTKNSTLIRNFGVSSGQSDWDCGQEQWSTLQQDDVSDLGQHQNKCSKGVHEIYFEFANPAEIDSAGKKYLLFDILVSANDDTTYIHNTALHLKYDTAAFGINIAL